jgi:ParB family chromosome partitioning protein
MIIENVQREDLNAMEEAQGYHALADEFKRSQEDIAKEVGKSRSHVANMMRLTKLPAEVQALSPTAIVGGPRPRADRRARSAGRGEAHRRGRAQRPPDRGAGA